MVEKESNMGITGAKKTPKNLSLKVTWGLRLPVDATVMLPPLFQEFLYSFTDKIRKQFCSRHLKYGENKIPHWVSPPNRYQFGGGNCCLFYFGKKTLSTRLIFVHFLWRL